MVAEQGNPARSFPPCIRQMSHLSDWGERQAERPGKEDGGMEGGLAKFLVAVIWVVGIAAVIWGFRWFSGSGKRRSRRRASDLQRPVTGEDAPLPPDAMAGRAFPEIGDPDARDLLREASQALSDGDRDRAAQLLRQAGGRPPTQLNWQVQQPEPEPERSRFEKIMEWSIRGVIVLAVIIAMVFIYLFTRGIIG